MVRLSSKYTIDLTIFLGIVWICLSSLTTPSLLYQIFTNTLLTSYGTYATFVASKGGFLFAISPDREVGGLGRKMMKSNDFHNTRVRVILKESEGYLTKRQLARAERTLRRISTCQCGVCADGMWRARKGDETVKAG